MASRYAPIWSGQEATLENAKNVGISECFDCDLEWNCVTPVNNVHEVTDVDDVNCPECGRPGVLTSPI